jgi:hypothetical protein
VPLSEHEQKILDEIEKNLTDEDARFAQARHPSRPTKKEFGSRARLGLTTFGIGFALLILFFVSRLLFVGLLAFVGMVAGIVLLASPVGALVDSAKENAIEKGAKVKRSVGGSNDEFRKRFRRP